MVKRGTKQLHVHAGFDYTTVYQYLQQIMRL